MAKDLAHGIVGEIAARIAGNAPGSGFTAAMTNEALADTIKKVAKKNPDVAQWLSAIVGGVVNQQIGKASDNGAAVAQYGMKWNENQYDPKVSKDLKLLRLGKNINGKERELTDILPI